MRGLNELIAMRKRGLKPSMVYVEMLPMNDFAKKLARRPGRYADIHMGQPDVKNVTTLDLRALLGLSVMVNGPDDASTEKVARACLNAGAATVQAFFFDLTRPEIDWITRAMRFTSEEVRVVWPK